MPGEVPLSERKKGVAAIAVTTLCFSLNFVAARPAALAFDPFALTFLRAGIAALVFVPLVALGKRRGALTLANLVAAVPLALACIVVNQVFFLLASRHTTPTHVALVVATIPVFVAILARVWLKERLAPRRVIGIGVAFLGVALLAVSKSGSGSARATTGGDLLAIVAAISFAGFTVANKRMVERLGAFPTTALVYLAGALLLLPIGLPRLLARGGEGVGAREWLSAGYLIVAATLIAYPLFSYALERLTASRVAVFTYLQPPLAAASSFALGFETFPPSTLVGAALAISGVALAQRRVPARPPDCKIG